MPTLPSLRMRRFVFVRCAAAIVLLGVQATLYWLSFGGLSRGLVGDEYSYITTARGILDTGVLVLDPLWPPLYPWLLAFVFSFGGEALWSIAVAQLGLLLVVAFAMRDIVGTLLDRPAAGNWVLWMVLTYPPLVAFAYFAWPEVLFLSLLLPAVALLIRWPGSSFAALLAGLLSGLAMLCKLVFGPLLILMAAALLRSGANGRQRAAAILVVVALLVVGGLGPQLRGDGVVARPDSNVAFNTLLGLKDTSYRTFVDSIAGDEYRAYRASADDVDGRTRVLYAKIRDIFQERGLVGVVAGQIPKQYLRLFDPESYFTAQLPGGAFDGKGSGFRSVSPGMGSLLRAVSWFAYFVLLALALLGLASCPWRKVDKARGAWFGVFLAFFVYNLGIFALLHVVSRYRIAILPVLFLFAAAGLDRLMASRVQETRVAGELGQES